ncbi:hypothetical protein [Desulfosporosinus youngiae]|uniref:Uncharacterized protein n=1 Tax=Desulfosporosinus youngiae DSM 17734 TaxID=768710 RepID=H5Y526_9FIRM|nr:hypothetical protein DesyoDRAFT_3093 [Desulfosporosinus youngiae DSM 17734]
MISLNKRKAFIGISAILTLIIVILIGNVSSVFSDQIIGKSSRYTEKEYAIKDSAIKTFSLDTGKVKALFDKDVFDNNIATESVEVRGKLANALAMLTDDNIFVVGDLTPIYFIEGNNVASIAIQHADGTISLTKFDISKEKPVKIDHKVKGAK